MASTSKETGASRTGTPAKTGVDKDQRTDAPGRDETSTEVSDPNASAVDPRNDAPGFVDEPALSTEAVIQRRTSTIDGGPEWPADGRYRKVFTVVVPRVSTGADLELDWNSDEHDTMHEANKVATLQEALFRGLHPQGEARFDGQEGDTDPRSYGSATLVYSVEVVPATDEGTEAAATYTPSFAIKDQGGSTLAEGDAWSDDRK
jgi:hypothetical protein